MKTSYTILAIALAGASLTAYGADTATNWTDHCAKCHGEDGKGNTKSGRKLDIKNLTDPKVQEGFTDAEALKAMKDGIKDKAGKFAMKPIEDLADDDMKALIPVVRGFKK